MSFDISLFELINGLAGRWLLLDVTMRLIVNDYFVPTTMALMLLALWLSGVKTNQRAVIQAVLAQGLSNAIVKACNLVYFRPRPFADPNLAVNLLFYRPSDSSFPSNPAAVGFAFATAVWLYNRRLGALMLALASLFALARVYCGVTYPVDALTGALIGGGVVYIVWRAKALVFPIGDFIIGQARRFNLA
jgi:undecaprenyl-diphosphatase